MKSTIKKVSQSVNLMIKVLSMIMVLISVTFAWHYFGKEVWVNPFDAPVQKVINIHISDRLDAEEWSDKLEITNVGNSMITEFSGNGDKLYIPVIENRTIKGYYKPDYSNGREKDFIEITTYLKTNGAIRLFIDPSSTVTPVDTKDKKGDIAGAVRVALMIENYKPYIWVPNTTYQYLPGSNAVNRDGVPEDKFTYVYKDSDDEFVSTSDIVTIDNSELKEAGVAEEDSRFVFGDLSKIPDYLKKASPIFETKDTGEEIIVKMTVRLFVEGTDREAVSSLVGGKIRLSLKFTSVFVE